MYARKIDTQHVFATKMSTANANGEQPHWEISLLSSQLYDKDFHINRSQNALFTWTANGLHDTMIPVTSLGRKC